MPIPRSSNPAWAFRMMSSAVVATSLTAVLECSDTTNTEGLIPSPINFAEGTGPLVVRAEFNGVDVESWRSDPLEAIAPLRGDCESVVAAVDHVALCVPIRLRDRCIHYLQKLRQPSDAAGRTIQSITPRLAFESFTIGGLDLNIISPLVDVPHLTRFLSRHPEGGILHFGVAVGSMSTIISRCRVAGIELLSDRLKSAISVGQSSVFNQYEFLIQNGFAEDRSDGGLLRQTFVFPSASAGDPFVEFIERRHYAGYGEEISAMLVSALDLASSA